MIKYLRNMWLLTMLNGSLGHPVTGRVWSDVITSSVLGQHFARAAGLYLWDSVNIIITSHVLTAQLSLHTQAAQFLLLGGFGSWLKILESLSDGILARTRHRERLSTSYYPELEQRSTLPRPLTTGDIMSRVISNVWFRRQRFALYFQDAPFPFEKFEESFQRN